MEQGKKVALVVDGLEVYTGVINSITKSTCVIFLDMDPATGEVAEKDDHLSHTFHSIDEKTELEEGLDNQVVEEAEEPTEESSEESEEEVDPDTIPFYEADDCLNIKDDDEVCNTSADKLRWDPSQRMWQCPVCKAVQ